jgi:excisionase family DNA binding protein
MQTQTIIFPRLGYSFAELEVLIGLSRSTLHRMVARGELETVKRGRRRLIPAEQVQRLCGVAEGPSTVDVAVAAATELARRKRQ